MKSSHIALLTFLAFLVSGKVSAQFDDNVRIWESLKETDRQFAERSRDIGVNQAFLTSFGEGAVVFRRGPVDAFATYSRRSSDDARRVTLESRANYIEFSRAGDLGLTTGPYRHTLGSGQQQRRTHGHFVTIWRKFSDEWRKVADMAVHVPGVLSLDVEPDLRDTERALAESALESAAEANSIDSLRAAEERYIAAINYRGGRRAALRYGLENMRIFVPGMAPGIGSESGSMAYGAFLDDNMAMSLVTYQPAGIFMAESGDAGYTYGTMNSEGSDFNTSYLRFWRFSATGEWRISVEVLSPY